MLKPWYVSLKNAVCLTTLNTGEILEKLSENIQWKYFDQNINNKLFSTNYRTIFNRDSVEW